jgi:tetratricopeptide (TPR) repeat protein
MMRAETLGQALELAREAVRNDGESQLAQRGALADYLSRLRVSDLAAEPDAEFIDRIDRLDQALSTLDMRELSLRTIQLALRHMEIKEAQDDLFSPIAWNRLGLLLADHGELDEARVVLNYALSKARALRSAEQATILVNLAALSLGAGNIDEAEIWATEAKDVAASSPAEDLMTPLFIASVLAQVAKNRGDGDGLEAQIVDLNLASRAIVRAKGPANPQALAAVAARVVAEFDAAWLSGSVPRMERVVDALETLAQKLSAARGDDDPETIRVSIRLATAEFDVAKAAGSTTRVHRAVTELEQLARRAARALGPDHPHTMAALANLADARDESSPAGGLREHIEQVYTARTNDKRNLAKSLALEREKRLVRLIAHAGASYFLRPLQRFKSNMAQGLERGVRFRVIISNPWNSLGIFYPADDADIRRTPDEIVRSIESSDYYQATFLPVLEAYSGLRGEYGDLIELRLTPMDVPGSTLITSDVGFFEPYMTANPEARTRHGLQAFEIEFTSVSRYYGLSVEMFETQWSRSSTVGQFRIREEEYKRQLRQLLDTRPVNP